MRLKHYLLFLLIAVGSFAHSQLMTFQNYDHKKGLYMAAINCINQSKDGYIWIGTDGAELIRFNGSTFEELRIPNGDNNHHYENLFFDGSDLLFASRYKGFYVYNTLTNTRQRISSGNYDIGDAISFLRHGDDNYFVGAEGIVVKNKSKNELCYQTNSRAELRISQMIEVPNGFILITNENTFLLQNGKVKPLGELTNISLEEIKKLKFGYALNKSLVLFNNTGSQINTFEIGDKNSFKLIKTTSQKNSLGDLDDVIVSSHFNSINKECVLLTKKGDIYTFKNGVLYKIPKNYNANLEQCRTIFVDLNGDYWCTSTLRGVYKISKEPFTKIQLDPVFESSDIRLPYLFPNGQILVSSGKGVTKISKPKDYNSFSTHQFSTLSIARSGNRYYFGTNKGIKVFDISNQKTIKHLYFKNQNINLVLADGKYLWAGISGKGLVKINTETKEEYFYNSAELPNYYYAGEISSDGRHILFGTNAGVYKLDKKSNKIARVIYDSKELGYYSGVSTKDAFETSWFTVEKGIVGILKTGEIKIIKGDEFFNTNLFFTLNSDKFGNLILGTNKGITMLKVNEKGEVQDVNYFDHENGFLGYETHMRSQFQEGNLILLGTVEGLFQANTQLLEYTRPPLAPVIQQIQSNQSDDTGFSKAYNFQFHVNNAKAGSIQYAYRVLENDKNWKLLPDGINNVLIHGLKNGEYNLEVKATFNEIEYGEITRKKIQVDIPIWKSSWFITLLIASVVLINIILLNYYKSFDGGKLLSTKDLDVHLKLTPTILLFTAITSPLSQLLAPYLNPELELHIGIVFFSGFVLFTLYFLSLTAQAKRQGNLYGLYLKLALITVMANFLWEVYRSNLHPFYIIGVILISTLVPYILSRIRTTIIFSVVLLLISVAYVILLNETIYPKFYFLIAIVVMVFLMIFSSYLRYDSLEKLLFVSAIINKGNIPAIAYDRNGVVTYASENISNFFELSHTEILNNNITILNNFIPVGSKKKDVDITSEFIDGEKYLVPMLGKENSIRWIEWDYRNFSENINVILGQDVSEKMELENTYELLVQNAEDFIYRCNVRGEFEFLNTISYTKLGYSKEDLLHHNSIDLVVDKYKPEIEKYYKDHFKRKKNTSYKEFPVYKKNNDIIWIGQYVTTLYAAGSKSHVSGFIALARDITNIRKQQQLIKNQRDAITDSINYARRIQYNLLPSEAQFSKEFDESFIISKPKDIVSGDYYWMEKVGKQTVLVVADCTGHGVPGSFMTLLGYNLLNSIVLENQTTDPASILNALDKKLIQYLPKGEGDNVVNDAMELTICVFDEDKNDIQYACAGSRFLIYENNSFTMYKGDNKHIGDIESNFPGYNTHTTYLTNDYHLFLFTDGFQDQFGGPKDKKFSFRRLLELFEANINLPLDEQRNLIEQSFDSWIGKTEQTDDITIISVKKNLKK